MKYSVIYADPAWTYRVWSAKGAGRTASSHYHVMTLEDMCALPVRWLAADDCALIMWATYPNLLEAFTLGAAWGFTYKTVLFTWAKTYPRAHGRFVQVDDPANWFMGLGHWTRANPEIALLFTRGNPKRVAKDVRNLVVAPVGKHSAKPLRVYRDIERLFGDVPRVELFARQRRAEWVSLGNEIDGRDLRESIPALLYPRVEEYPYLMLPAKVA